MIPESLKLIIGAIIRGLLQGVAGYLVAKGWVSEGDAELILAGIAVGAAALAWSLWQKYRSRISFVTALSMPENATEAQVKEALKTSIPSVKMWMLPLGLLLTMNACGDSQLQKTEEGVRKIYVGLQGASDGIDAIYRVRLEKLQTSLASGQITTEELNAKKKEAAQTNLAGQEALKKVATAVKIFKNQVRALPAITQDDKVNLLPLLDSLIMNVDAARAAGLMDIPSESLAEINSYYELLKGGVILIKSVIGGINKPVPITSVPALVQ
jgi:hypothetical protein